MDCSVVVEAAVPVYDVETPDEAVRIAVSKTGDMLNPDLNYVEISMGDRNCAHCGEGIDPAFIAADEGLVALELEMTVFNVEREEHASRIARKEIGQRLDDIPLKVLAVDVLEGTDKEDDSEDSTNSVTGGKEPDRMDDTGTDEDVLPDFDDLIE
jgi:uncharacterized protein (UPF0212 family)